MNGDIHGRMNAQCVKDNLTSGTHKMVPGFSYKEGVPRITLEVVPKDGEGLHYTLGDDGDWWLKVKEAPPYVIAFYPEGDE